ncbi:FG-GAP repeat domain-containing protein [Streptomyces sp. NPDC018693]|uniref:FG-GAP repeat domain-containing protein n=1 Tax=unclassified Streptomyces TaxID=2593676 RepID=UPI00378D4C02
MIHTRPAGRRLVAAATTVLAVTLGATALTAPAIAAPAAEGTATATTTAQGVIPFPMGDRLTGATASGYLTYNATPGEGGTIERRWIPADGSAPTDLLWSVRMNPTGIGDLVGMLVGSEARLVDMATGQNRLSVFLGTRESLFRYVGAAGNALFTSASNETGGLDLRMHTKAGGERPVTGLPADVTSVSVGAGTPEHGLLTYTQGSVTEARRFRGLVDLATGAVTETYEIPRNIISGDAAVSATHFARVEHTTGFQATIVVVNRANGTEQRIPLGSEYAPTMEIGLVGDWVTYGMPGGLTSGDTNSLYALTARNLTDGTTRKLLDHLTSAAAAPGGTQVVRGGTVAQGEGLYRIAPDDNGVPTATFVASTGEPTKLTLLSHNVPATIDLDVNRGRVPLEWNLSRSNAELKVTLRHTRTGKTSVAYLHHPETPSFRYEWQGDLGWDRSAYNGDYTWEISARPLNGIGPTLTASGTFKVVRKPAPHDYTDNGSPDVLMRDSAGRLLRADSYYSPYANDGQLVESEEKLIGSGWQIYNQIEAVGNIAGASTGDLVARDKDGVLWEYLGKGDGTFAPRVRIGGGWNIYNKITGGSDLNGDGRADLLATDTSGGLYLYKGTGDWRAPFAPRVKIGWGWGIYNQIVATGNIAGAPAGDLVARDKDGVLWLYLGKGDGTFASRVRIGGGWNAYTQLVGIGDANRDGRPDLFAYGASGSYLYQGTGSWSAPFRARELTGVAWRTEPMYNAVI